MDQHLRTDIDYIFTKTFKSAIITQPIYNKELFNEVKQYENENNRDAVVVDRIKNEYENLKKMYHTRNKDEKLCFIDSVG